MTDDASTLTCPGCVHALHSTASHCPHCGFRPRAARNEEILGSLSTIGSILAGFGLAAVVQLATIGDEHRNDWLILITEACWLVASMLMLAVTFGSELLRRNEETQNLHCPPEHLDSHWERITRLLNIFMLALLPFGVGILAIGYFLSIALGVAASVAAIGAILALYFVLG